MDSNDCIERCDGIIVDAINQNKQNDLSNIQELLRDYESYEFPNKSDIPFPTYLNCKYWNIFFCKKFTHQL